MTRRVLRYRCWSSITLCVLALNGCVRPVVENRGEVRGTVVLDGEPLAEGSILFEPTGGNSGPVSGATIRDGKYHVVAKKGPPIGLNRIEINGVKRTGRKIAAPPPGRGMIDEIVEMVPDRYNEESKLEREVTKGENVIDFELESES